MENFVYEIPDGCTCPDCDEKELIFIAPGSSYVRCVHCSELWLLDDLIRINGLGPELPGDESEGNDNDGDGDFIDNFGDVSDGDGDVNSVGYNLTAEYNFDVPGLVDGLCCPRCDNADLSAYYIGDKLTVECNDCNGIYLHNDLLLYLASRSAAVMDEPETPLFLDTRLDDLSVEAGLMVAIVVVLIGGFCFNLLKGAFHHV